MDHKLHLWTTLLSSSEQNNYKLTYMYSINVSLIRTLYSTSRCISDTLQHILHNWLEYIYAQMFTITTIPTINHFSTITIHSCQ